MPIAAIMKILLDLVAAAPSITSTVEEAVTALQSSSDTGSQKVQAVATAASHLALGVNTVVDTLSQKPGA